MLLERLDLKAFGRFTDVSLELNSGSRNFHLIYGPNEAGKSTSLRAITSLLFGMESNTNDCFLHRPTDIRVGGVLLDPESGSRLECVRRRGRKQTLRDADDRDPISNEQLHQFLGAIGRETFETRFGLSYDALVDGGEAITKGGGDLGEILFSAGAGVSQLRKLQDEFEDAASSLFAPRASKSSINAALKGMDADRQAMKDLQVSTSTYERLRSDLEKHLADGTDLKEQLTQSVKQVELLKSYREAVSLIPAWRDAKEGLLQFEGVPTLTDEFVAQRHDAHSALEIAKAQREKLQERLKALRQRESKLCPDLSLLQCELQVQNAFQELAIYKKSEQECQNAIKELQGLDLAVNDLLRTLSKLVPTSGMDLSTREARDEQQSERYRLHASSLLRMRDLTQQHKDLVLREREANEAVDSARVRLKSINQQLSVLGDVGDPSLLTELLESVGKPAMISETISRQRDQCGKMRCECQQALANLTGFHGELREALAIEVPDQTLLDDYSVKIEELEARSREQELKMQQWREELEQVQTQLSNFADNTECPSDDQIGKAISERDEFVNHFEQSPLPADERVSWVGDLRALIGGVDQLLNERFKYAEQIQQRIALQRQRESLEAVLASHEKQRNELQDASSAMLIQWEDVWAQVGVRAGSVAEMQKWAANHLALRQIALAVDEEEARLSRLLSAATRDVQRLQEAIGLSVPSDSAGAVQDQLGLFEDRVEDELISIWDQVARVRSERDEDWKAYQFLVQKREGLLDDLPHSERRLANAVSELKRWGEAWKKSGVDLIEIDDFDAGDAVVWLDQLSQLNDLFQRRDELNLAIEQIQKDRSSFIQTINDLATLLGEQAPSNGDVVPFIQSTYQRLQAQRETQQSLKNCEEEIGEIELKMVDADTQLAAATANLTRLCHEAGVGSVEELPDAEKRSRMKMELDSKFKGLDDDLRRLASDQDFYKFIDDASAQTQSVWKLEIDKATQNQDLIHAASEKNLIETGAVENELSKVDGDAKASDLRQKMELTAGQIRYDAELYLIKRLGFKLLHQAIEHYRQKNQSPVLALGEQYFSELTCGEYIELRPDYDASGKATLQAVHRSGLVKSVGEMSTGTADSLYLALRLASMQHQMENSKSIPVVIDDCLIQLDDRRALAALRALSELSTKTQVILFTHHQHLIDLARGGLEEAAVAIHQLGV